MPYMMKLVAVEVMLSYWLSNGLIGATSDNNLALQTA